jgi:hypothetical protein
VLAWYKAANFLDCRIRAYHGCDGIAPSTLLVDIDKGDKQFKTAQEFELCISKTRANFKKILGSQPTELWTGGGIHFVQPQSAPIFEKIPDFNTFKQSSIKFMRFEEQLLTDNKADQNHSNNVSFGNCMLRVPGSLNSKYVWFSKGEMVDIPSEAEARLIVIPKYRKTKNKRITRR